VLPRAVPRSTARPTMAPPRVLSPVRAPADGWTRHRRVAPLQSPTSAPQRASDCARRSTSDAEEDGAVVGSLSPARAPADGWMRRRRAAPRQGPTRIGHGGSRARSRERRLEIYPRGEWIHPQPVVAATGSPQKGESRDLSSSSTKLRSSPSIFFYPDLDPHA
jgi:hypothetical protein